MINNHRTWKLSYANGGARYLYRHINGKWYFGSVLGSNTARIFSRISGSPLTTDLMWRYYNGSKWKDSSTLTVSSRTRCSVSEHGSGYELLQESARCKNGGSVMIAETLSLKNCSYECGETHGATIFRHGRVGTATCSGEDQCYCRCVLNANLDTCLVDIDTTGRFNLYKINPPPDVSNITLPGENIVPIMLPNSTLPGVLDKGEADGLGSSSQIAVSCIHVKTTGGEIDFDTHKYLGYYKLIDDMINNHRTWKLSSNGRARYLYRYINGQWYIGSSLGSKAARIFSRISDSPLTTDLTWRYYNGSKWKDSSTLTVSSSKRCSASENGSGYELLQESAWCKNGDDLTISEALSLKNCSYECGETHGATIFRHCKAETATFTREDQCYCICVINANPVTCLVDTTGGFNLYKINPPAGGRDKWEAAGLGSKRLGSQIGSSAPMTVYPEPGSSGGNPGGEISDHSNSYENAGIHNESPIVIFDADKFVLSATVAALLLHL